ncbi:MAG: sulfotransferase family protein [Candidatus Woesearchaeota archaeon]
MTRTILIGGSGRSGTNIVKELLSQHSKTFSLPFEHRFTIDPRGVIDFYNSFAQNWSPYYADHKLEDLSAFLRMLSHKDEEREVYSGWELEEHFPRYTAHVDELIRSLKSFTYKGSWPGSDKEEMAFAPYRSQEELKPIFRTFFDNLIRGMLKRHGKELFVEDNTWNTLYARELLDLIPDSKILHVVRDPRDVVASLTRQGWTPNELPQVIEWYRSVMRKWEHQKQLLAEDEYLEVRLEDLVARKKETITKMCSFIGIEPEQTLSDFPLDKAHTGRWKQDFTPSQQETVTEELSSHLEEYGYRA